MKIISKEEEDAHFSVVLKGGLIGGSVGLALGLGGVIAGSKRYPTIRNLTLPFRSFLVTSAGTFGAIVWAERYSIDFQRSHDSMYNYMDASHKAAAEARAAAKSDTEKLMDWGRENRYSIVFTSWIAAMGLALAMVGKNKYLSGSQKLVQARMYAQGLTLAVLIATAAFETADAKAGKGRWETVMVVDPEDPEHKHLIEKRVRKEDYEGQNLWQDMVEAEERRLAEQKKHVAALEKKEKAPAS
ncbi:Replication factor C, subunit RFC4 [Podospora bellae-mahoneyi]|uniref:Replication factor C, subunit RFC4 n=1 Tax=Podospora bellae-mahoneyi TaxID=2093777 RepID=A0ABR0FV10_9PEZI|nr:Replication factor C, subunit RFC4 [Podospora bellae-mahoneyi]